MTARGRAAKAEQELSERQRYWLNHLQTAEAKGEQLKTYAKRLGLSEHSMYEAKRRLRKSGVIAPASQQKVPPPEFARVVVGELSRSCSLQVRFASGAVLEWSAGRRSPSQADWPGLVMGPSEAVAVLLYRDPVDMRKSINGKRWTNRIPDQELLILARSRF
ncbi:MAG: transposase [bacterium]|nr:transposase [bacterium]